MSHARMLADAERAYHADPNNEALCCHLIAGYLAHGRRDEALALCLSLHERLEAAGNAPSEETRLLMNRLTATPAVSRSGWSRRRMLQWAALGVLTVVGVGVWKSAQRPVPTAAVAKRSAESWNAEGNRYATEAAADYHAGRYNDSGAKAMRAAQCYQQSGNGAGEAGVTLVLGECEQARGNLWSANGYFAQGLQLHRLHSGKEAVEHALELCGTLAVRQGRYENARQCFKESLELSWQKNDKGEIDKSNILSVMCGQGLLAAETGHRTEAAEIYAKASDYASVWNKKPMVAWLQMLQGTLAMNQGDYQKSETLLTNAQTYWEAQKDASPRWIAAAANRLSALRLAQLNLGTVQKHLDVSLPIYLEVQDKLGQADTHLLRGRLFVMQGRLDAAETELQTAQAFFDDQGLLPRAARCRLVMSALRFTQNRLAESQQEREKANATLQQSHTQLTKQEADVLLWAILDRQGPCG